MCALMVSSLGCFGTGAMILGILSGMLYSCMYCLFSSWLYFLLSNNGLTNVFFPFGKMMLYLISSMKRN